MQSKDFYKEMVEIDSAEQRDRFLESKIKSGEIIAVYKIDGDLTDFSPNDYEDEDGAFMCFEDRSILFALYSQANDSSTFLPIGVPEDEDFGKLMDLLSRLSSRFAKEIEEYHGEQYFITFDLKKLTFGATAMLLTVPILHLSFPVDLTAAFVALLGFTFALMFPVIRSGVEHAE